jgi:hypothetical protein
MSRAGHFGVVDALTSLLKIEASSLKQMHIDTGFGESSADEKARNARSGDADRCSSRGGRDLRASLKVYQHAFLPNKSAPNTFLTEETSQLLLADVSEIGRIRYLRSPHQVALDESPEDSNRSSDDRRLRDPSTTACGDKHGVIAGGITYEAMLHSI